MPLKSPISWTTDQLRADAEKATARFRHERLDEPLEKYVESYTTFYPIFERVIARFTALRSHELDLPEIISLLSKEPTRRALCYLTAPPISDDDLKTLAEAPSFAAKRLAADPATVIRLRDLLFRILDPKRFVWIEAGREATAAEIQSAVMASAALVATQKVQTFRRNESKNRQEKSVKDALVTLGFTEIKKRPIPNVSVAPKPGEFLGETPVAGAKADVVVGLHDGRMLLIECKVSNSSVNSYKRIVHDTGGKATTWYREIGRANLVAAAVLSGVYSVANLEIAQNDKGVSLFWDHRMSDLMDFIKSIR